MNQSTALLLIDLQNDFVHPRGAYARAGQTAPEITALAARLAPLAEAARAIGIPVISTHFTLFRGRDGAPIIAPHLRAVRPFLTSGDFVAGGWGHAMIEDLGVADAAVNKVAYSAFAHTPLGWLLDKFGITELIVGGIVTNGGVASTVREAHVRELKVTLLTDGCAAFDSAIHDATVTSLGSVTTLATCAEVLAALKAHSH